MQPKLQYYEMGEGVTAFSTTRDGGYSSGSYGQFNINPYCGDSSEAVARNRDALCRMLGLTSDRLLLPHQVHKTEMAVVSSSFLLLSDEERQAQLDGVDAVMTDEAGVCIGVSTADCIPVLLSDRVRHAVCAVHAGWRGTVQRIVEQAVARMGAVYGSRPCDLVAQTGPGIQMESFEVGDEVYDAFASAGFDMEMISGRYRSNDGRGEKWHIDLPACNRQQLLSAGLSESNITVSRVCTYRQSEVFFSARREGINSGRIFTGVVIRG